VAKSAHLLDLSASSFGGGSIQLISVGNFYLNGGCFPALNAGFS
jgi:hypothetical protein